MQGRSVCAGMKNKWVWLGGNETWSRLYNASHMPVVHETEISFQCALRYTTCTQSEGWPENEKRDSAVQHPETLPH